MLSHWRIPGAIVFGCICGFAASSTGATIRHRPPDLERAIGCRPAFRTPPPHGEVVNPAEFCRADGVLLAWAPDGDIAEVLGDIAYVVAADDTVYMVATSVAQREEARAYLTNRGVDMNRVVFILDLESWPDPWIRDFGPFCVFVEGALAIADFYYGFGAGVDNMPEVLADHFGLPFYQTNVLHVGGNHISDGNGMAFVSDTIWSWNPGYTHEQVREHFRQYLGIDSLTVVPAI